MQSTLVLKQGEEVRLNKSLQIFITNFHEEYNDRIYLQQNKFGKLFLKTKSDLSLKDTENEA